MKTTELTIEQFNKIPAGQTIAMGVSPNSPEGIFMTTGGGNLRWVAVKGYANDWAIYCHWDHHSSDWIRKHGDKVHAEENIKRCVPCTDEVFNLYRH